MSATETITAPVEITAENVATIFPEVDTSLARDVLPSANGQSTRQGTELEGYDEEQVRLMDEVCIVLDNNDKPIGSGSKKLCESIAPVWFTFTQKDMNHRPKNEGQGYPVLHEPILICHFLYVDRPFDDQHR